MQAFFIRRAKKQKYFNARVCSKYWFKNLMTTDKEHVAYREMQF